MNITFIIDKIIDKDKVFKFFILLKKTKVKFLGKIIFRNNSKLIKINSAICNNNKDVSHIIKKAWQLHLLPIHYKEYNIN